MSEAFQSGKRFKIRNAELSDAGSILTIYSPHVTEGITSLEFCLPTEAEIQQRMESIMPNFPWLVCECEDGTMAGYAYGSRHRVREGYQWVAEVGIYVAEHCRGQNVGFQLYEKLCEILKQQGYFHALAIISGNNTRNFEFHKKCGFSFVGEWKNYGNKFGNWFSVFWYSKMLQELKQNPDKPVPYSAIKNLVVFS